ncbi:hypothetical protein AB0D71_14050 [Streptomyces avermitilis]|uniref:carbohydrate ABC transporter permease n=1 Tax=Streptomyces avermitilis TaxID=33903 RepID=UPI0033FB0CCE
MAAIVLITLLPFYWVLRTALSANAGLDADPGSPLPAGLTGSGFARALGLQSTQKAIAQGGAGGGLVFWRYLLNSVIVSTLITVCQIFFSSMAAYAFARLCWRGRDKVFGLFLAGLMVPAIFTLLPNFVAGGGSFRTNEFRRVGYPSHIRESRFRFFGTDASMEQLATVALWQDKEGVKDITELLEPKPTMDPDDPSLQHIAPELRAAFTSGSAPVHDRSRLPREFDRLHNGHEGSHHFLVDDFVTAVNTRTLPSVNAWGAARYTLPGVVAHESARQGGTRLEIPDFGDAPEA